MPTYPEIICVPMREELTSLGVKELTTADAVDQAVKSPGATMVVVNSVCGCAAGRMR
ncbi:MAG TPA: BrxA/BrxB family bacilliredoxin, partial [Candidatus Sulfotelmatobacter sp.]|nr:BrxA/BrxB family bacilliredoxin [Candidatus Sulfotelmatobacter sp.]